MLKMINQRDLCKECGIECNDMQLQETLPVFLSPPSMLLRGPGYVSGVMHKILAHFQLIKVSPVLADCAPSLPIVG